jgi:hypothetical protein
MGHTREGGLLDTSDREYMSATTTQNRVLDLWGDYTREDVHAIFSPHTTFTPQAGTWGLQGMIRIPNRLGDWVFFVTFGQEQGDHAFDESITEDGVLSWQSQPSLRLTDNQIRELVRHDERTNSIYLFLRTTKRGAYTYLGTLGYLTHDAVREAPVYFQWQLLDWPPPQGVIGRIGLTVVSVAPGVAGGVDNTPANRLDMVAAPTVSTPRNGVTTQDFKSRKSPNYAERDHKNRQLGLDGELLVLANEIASLRAGDRDDLADKVVHVSVIEGDGAGYDIQSYTLDGHPCFIEVKTTKGGAATPFFVSPNELAFSEAHMDAFRLVRVFEFDSKSNSGKAFEIRGSLKLALDLKPTEFRASLKCD